MRLYSFVANLYLSPLQHGLQTAHVVSELHAQHLDCGTYTEFDTWARMHKTIIICAAINSAGVLNAYRQLEEFERDLGLPAVIFHEDEASLNGAATACGIIVPAQYYEAKMVVQQGVLGYEDFPAYQWTTFDENGSIENHMLFPANSIESQFITFLKSYRLA